MAGNTFFDQDEGFDKLMTTFSLNDGGSTVDVGFLRSSGMHKNADLSVAALAAVHEFGSSDGRIPERSFMRSAVDGSKNQLQALVDKISAKVFDGDMDRKKGLGLIGQFLKDRIVAKINSGVPPPNAPSTVARKGSSKTLIDTGQLKNSVDWEVTDGKGS